MTEPGWHQARENPDSADAFRRALQSASPTAARTTEHGKTVQSSKSQERAHESHPAGFAEGSQPQQIDRTLAEIAADARSDTSGGVKGWRRLADDELRKLGLDPSHLEDRKSHFHSYLYTDGHGHYALAFRATEMTNKTDWLNDVLQLAGKSPQYDDALKIAKEVTGRLGEDNVVMVGHSKGGGEADAAAIETGSAAVTFNGAGVSDATIERLGLDPARARAKLAESSRNYAVSGDILTEAQEHSPLPKSSGRQIYLPDPDPERKAQGDERVHENNGVLKVVEGLEDEGRHAVWLHLHYREAMDSAAESHTQ